MVKNLFDSFSMTTAAVPGVASAVSSGVVRGIGQSGTAAKKAASLLTEVSGQRDSLLQALKVLFEDLPEADHSALDTYREDLKEILVATNGSSAAIVKNLLLIASGSIGHLSQIPFDGITASKNAASGLLKTNIPTDKINEAIHQASTFEVDKQGSSASFQNVAQEISKQADEHLNNVYNEIDIPHNSHAKIHALAASLTAAGMTGSTAAVPVTGALLTDTTGQILRESSAVRHFSTEESAENNARNVYFASSGVTNATGNSDTHESEQKLEAFEGALSQLDPASELFEKHCVASPLSTALLRLIMLSLPVTLSRVANQATIVTTEGRIQKALADATAQGPSAGVDRINSLKTNICSLSNIMRLCAENLGGSSAAIGTVKSSEVISVRSLSILISHVKDLSKALHDLIDPEQAQNPSSSIASLSDLSRLEMQRRSEEKDSEAVIRKILDDIELENRKHVIPDLNRDMASQINSSIRSGLHSITLVHSLLSNPVTMAFKASENGVHTEDAQKNEALMKTLPGLTQTLNAVQAFTRNMMAEMEQESRMPDVNSVRETVGKGTAVFYWAVSAISLLADEMISICRSLTLIDQDRLNAALQKSSEVPCGDESAQSSEQMAFDSHSQQPFSAIHAITALRLTLSHTGILLSKIAVALHAALKDNMDTVQANLAMHTLQKCLLASTAHALPYLVESLLLSSGSLSAFPVALNGSVDGSHRIVHATDAHLHPVQTHSCEKLSDACESSQATGFSTDMIAGIITNVLKVLAQSSLIGLDTALKLIKLLEIISLHRDPHIALKLESQDASNPNGVSKNLLSAPSVGASAGIGAVLINLLAALQSMDKSCGSESSLSAQGSLVRVVDQQIENLSVLKDEEEENNGKKGLKEFYRIIIELLSPNGGEACERLLQRLNFGGICLSAYHSFFGAYGDRPVPDLRFIARFANDDDAHGILRHFMDRAIEDFTLLKALHDALPENERSLKAQILYDHVFEEIFQNYKQVKMSDLALHGLLRRKIPTRDSFRLDVGLGPLQPPANHIQNAPQMG